MSENRNQNRGNEFDEELFPNQDGEMGDTPENGAFSWEDFDLSNKLGDMEQGDGVDVADNTLADADLMDANIEQAHSQNQEAYDAGPEDFEIKFDFDK